MLICDSAEDVGGYQISVVLHIALENDKLFHNSNRFLCECANIFAFYL